MTQHAITKESVEHALSLMAEAAAHGVTILYSRLDIGLSTVKHGTWESAPAELINELDIYADEIWAIMHSYRARAAR